MAGRGAVHEDLKPRRRGALQPARAGALLALVLMFSFVTVGCGAADTTTTAPPATAPSSTVSTTSTGTVSSSATSTVSSSTTATTDDSANRVRIEDSAFQPATLTVATGATVTWRNDDELPHTVTADDGSFSSPNMPPDARYSFTFEAPGSYLYHCSIHPHMQGTVIVQ